MARVCREVGANGGRRPQAGRGSPLLKCMLRAAPPPPRRVRARRKARLLSRCEKRCAPLEDAGHVEDGERQQTLFGLARLEGRI